MFDRVSFAYDAHAPVLEEVSFEARPGEMVALVGLTGAGKTTAVSMIPRFYDPASGRVLIDGMDRHHVGMSDGRGGLGLAKEAFPRGGIGG